jgi:hypothetical protein
VASSLLAGDGTAPGRARGRKGHRASETRAGAHADGATRARARRDIDRWVGNRSSSPGRPLSGGRSPAVGVLRSGSCGRPPLGASGTVYKVAIELWHKGMNSEREQHATRGAGGFSADPLNTLPGRSRARAVETPTRERLLLRRPPKCKRKPSLCSSSEPCAPSSCSPQVPRLRNGASGQYIFSNDEHRGFDVFKITAKGHRH